MGLFHSQGSSPEHQGTDLSHWLCTLDRMPELGAADIQDQMCKDAQASLQSSLSRLDKVVDDLNSR